MAMPESMIVDVVERLRFYKDSSPRGIYNFVLKNWDNLKMDKEQLYFVLNHHMFRKIINNGGFRDYISAAGEIEHRMFDVDRTYSIKILGEEIDLGVDTVVGRSLAKVSLSLLDDRNRHLRKVSVYFDNGHIRASSELHGKVDDWLKEFGFRIREQSSLDSLLFRMDQIEQG